MTQGSEDPRTAYWNEQYLAYWRGRVEEAAAGGRSGIVPGDPNTEGDWVYEEVFRLAPFNPGVLLDVGCAWGRMFPLYFARDVEVIGVDISAAMIEAARRSHGADARVRQLIVSPAEAIPLADRSVDNLACLAVFDATYQERALAEFLRVLRPGGLLLLTGKNGNYPADDEAALAAEIGARRKGHPNFFTDVPLLLRLLERDGQRVERRFFFRRRGDFARFEHATEMPERFYEWLIAVRAGGAATAFPKLSDAYSQVCKSRDDAAAG
jgi:ubiquinone/menaquinone biosynthesis C-methylase UbiE